MSEKTTIFFPAWEGLGKLDRIAGIVSEFRPEAAIPCGHAREITTQYLMITGKEDGHIEVKYWFPMWGTVWLEMEGFKDESYGMQWNVVGLRAKWKANSCLRKKMALKLYREEVILIEQIVSWRHYSKDYTDAKTQKDLEDIETRGRDVIGKMLITEA
jgi:hypothetical protein